MEDVNKKLEIDNPFIKIQAINKLLTSIEKSKPVDGAINGSTPTIQELDLLWDLTDNECPVISNASSQALVSLAIHSYAEVGYIVNGILNRITSAKHVNGLTSAIKDLLLSQAVNTDSAACYSGRLSQHPFVVILRQCSHAWPYILEHVKHMLSIEEKREEIFEILSPFFHYILSDPNHPAALAVLRCSLQRCLVDICQHNQDKSIFNFLIATLKWLRLESISELQESCEFLQNVTIIMMMNERELGNDSQVQQVALCLTAVAYQMLTVDLDPSNALQSIHRLLVKYPVSTYNHFTDGLALLIGQMLENSSPVHHTILTRITETILHQNWSSTLVGASFLLPLLHIVSMPCTAVLDGKPSAQKQASCLIRYIETNVANSTIASKRSLSSETLQRPITEYDSLHTTVAHALQFAALAQKLQHSSHIALWWLENIQSKLASIGHEWHFLSHILSGIVVHGLQDRQLIKKAVSVIVALAQADAKQAHNLFPLLLHKVGIETDIDIRLHIMHNLPDIATHKICIGPVLQTLQMLSSTPQLQALALRLTARLWKHQERIFPFLLHLIVEKIDEKQSEGYDGIVAKAASLKDICEINPQQYGAECLPSLSYILAKNLNEAGTVPSVLALDGVISLCKSEVIDLRTTWKVLAPKLSKDSRPLVIKKLCELFALIPELEVNSTEFETFKSDVCSWMWKQVCANKDPVSVGAAYCALGKIEAKVYKLKSLPETARADLELPPGMAATPYEKAKKPEDVLTEIPGTCFTKILSSLNHHLIPDFGKFLASQIKNEVRELPRGVYHSAWRTNRVAQGNKVLGAIPALLANKHEYNKVPGLQGSLAGGVLLCYEPPVEYGSNSQPLPRSFATQARAYQMKLEILLNEVPIGAAEWQRSLALSQAWTTYMERAYFVSVEGRKAELEMQQKHGTLKPTEDFKLLTDSAWLWARDRLCNILRGSAKGKPAAQGNTILALGGLAAAVAKFTSTLDPESWKKESEENAEHLGHILWMPVAIETILSVMSGSLAKGRVFTWFQSGEKATSTLSMLVKACGAISIAQLAPYMANHDAERVREVVAMLDTMLRNSESPALQLYTGLGLGFFLMHLYQQRFGETGGADASEFLDKTAKSLLQWAMSDDMDIKVGSVLGLTAAACAMCLDSSVDSRLNGSDIQSIVLEKIETETQESVIHEVLCLSAVCITAVACTNAILTMEIAESVLLKLESLLKKTPNSCGIAAALGLLIYWLQRASYPNAPEMKDHLLKVWLPALASESAPTLTRLAAIHGLCALFGMQSSLMLLPENILQNDSDSGLNELLNIMSQIVSLSKDIGMQNSAAWMLGQLFLVCGRDASSKKDLPANYSYLSTSSILRAVVDYIGDFNKAGKFESGGQDPTLFVCLEALAQPFSRPLPPLDWAGLLTFVIRCSQDEETRKTALKIAINQSGSSPAAATLMASMLAGPLFCALPITLQIFLYESLPRLIKNIPANKLRSFVEVELSAALKCTQSQDIKLAAIRGLQLALEVSDPPQGTTQLLHQTAEIAYGFITLDDQEAFSVYCKIATNLPDQILDNITGAKSIGKAGDIEKAVAIRSYLVKEGKQPLNWLNEVIDLAATLECDKQQILLSLFSDLQHVAVYQPEDRSSWLLEIMGNTKNVLDWKSRLTIDTVDHMCQVVNFFVELYGTVVLSWASSSISLPVNYPHSEQTKLIDPLPLELLPLAFPVLFKLEPYRPILSKAIDWFILLCEKDGVISTKMAGTLKAALCSVRQTKEFSKTLIWTRVITF